ncbi:hypothetical protein ACFWAA_17880 [Streptomyces sp. NPDC059922]|uniref:hypothetical protein n=1 Tax=Streptomyces sp. NPDC059922 TaxID=3347005 RepID=UPI003649C574
MADFAMPLSMEVICRLLGVPQEKRFDFRAWTNTLLSAAAGAAPQSREAMRHMYRFLGALIDGKREKPGDDLLSALILAHDMTLKVASPPTNWWPWLSSFSSAVTTTLRA